MPKEYDPLEIYPKQPLDEVVCEIRFPNNLAIECNRHLFYDKIQDAYPSIVPVKFVHNRELPTTTYRFDKTDGSAGIMLSMNKFSYYEKQYRGHIKFIDEFLRLSKILGNTYKLDKINRLGWRYINVIPFVRERGFIPISDFIDFKISAEGISNEFENLRILFVSKAENGSITTRLESIQRPKDNQEALLLDFDFGMTENLCFSEMSSYIKKAHGQTKELFENFITPEYREVLRGEVI
jgi:uncharacterized protein (TIGR04255 family)